MTNTIFAVLMLCVLLIILIPAICHLMLKWWEHHKMMRDMERTVSQETEEIKEAVIRLENMPLLKAAKRWFSGYGNPWDEVLTNDNQPVIFTEVLNNPKLIRNVKCFIVTDDGVFEHPDTRPEVEATYAYQDKVEVIFKPIYANKTGVVKKIRYIFRGVLMKTVWMNLDVNEGDTLKLRYSLELGGNA